MKPVVRLVTLGSLLVLVGSCGPAYAGGRGTRGVSVSRSCTQGFGASAAARKLASFVGAAATFTAEAAELGVSLTATCYDMGETLGLPVSEMQPRSSDVLPVEAACGAVAAKLREETTAIKAAANVEVVVEAQPPVCEVRVEAYAECIASCEVEIEPGVAEIECRGGELRGTCRGECRGRCAVDAQATCNAVCEGTCNGGCEGACAVRGPDGRCAGVCDGTCNGRCDGQCVARVDGGCEGECRGECSVQFEAPRCTGRVEPPRASAECKAACEARVDAQAECRPGSLVVDVRGTVSSDLDERVARVRQALLAGLPSIRAARAKLDIMGEAAGDMVRSGRDLPTAVAEVGVNAAACATQAIAAVADASVTVTASVEVTASVTASVGG